MKIAILTSRFPPEGIGGTEIVSYNVAKKLAEKGHEVHIITSGNKKIPRQELKDGFYIHRIIYPKIRTFGILIFWLKIYFCIKKVNPDMVHCQTAQMGLPCFFAKKIFNIPYIVYCHGSDVYLKWKFKTIISKIVFSRAGAVIALTEDMKNKIKEYYKKEVIIIPNGINLGDFEGLSKEISRRKLEIGSNEKIIIFAGRLSAVKGIEYLIEAYLIVKDRMPGIKLFLVGGGEEEQKLKNLVLKSNLEKDITFTGNVSGDKIPIYMTAADILILPSLSEGLPVVLLEALASGLPIIASRVRGIPELVKDKENGFLVEPRNPNQIAEKILYLFSSDELRKNISLKNIEKAENYSWDLIIDKLLKIYSSCLKK